MGCSPLPPPQALGSLLSSHVTVDGSFSLARTLSLQRARRLTQPCDHGILIDPGLHGNGGRRDLLQRALRTCLNEGTMSQSR